MLRGKNERTFCSTSTSSRRRRTVGGVTSWWIWWDDESLLVGPRGAIAVEGDAAWCVSSENIAKNRSWPRLLRRKLKIQRVEGNFRGWKEERGTRRKARRRRRRRRGDDEEGKDRKWYGGWKWKSIREERDGERVTFGVVKPISTVSPKKTFGGWKNFGGAFDAAVALKLSSNYSRWIIIALRCSLPFRIFMIIWSSLSLSGFSSSMFAISSWNE